MQYRNSNECSIRRTAIFASLATLATIGLFSLIATLTSQAIDQPGRRPDDAIPMLEVTVVKARREAVARAERQGLPAPKLEII